MISRRFGPTPPLADPYICRRLRDRLRPLTLRFDLSLRAGRESVFFSFSFFVISFTFLLHFVIFFFIFFVIFFFFFTFLLHFVIRYFFFFVFSFSFFLFVFFFFYYCYYYFLSSLPFFLSPFLSFLPPPPRPPGACNMPATKTQITLLILRRKN